MSFIIGIFSKTKPVLRFGFVLPLNYVLAEFHQSYFSAEKDSIRIREDNVTIHPMTQYIVIAAGDDGVSLLHALR